MIEAIVQYNGSTLIMDLPRSVYDIYEKLISIGCPIAPGRIPLTDNEDDALRVKLYGRIEMGNHLIRMLSEQNTLADANALAFAVLNASNDIKLKLGEKIVKDQYGSIPEIVADIRQMTYDAGPIKRTFYCPLVGNIEGGYDDTISPHTFIVKAQWNSYPYVYHFPNSGLAEDNCKFTWVGFTNYWFNYYNPGGKPETSPYIVRNETNGSLAIEQFLARIILGNSYGAWDKLDVAKGQTVATDSSLYAAVLKYLGASDLAIQNYLDAYYGKLSISPNGSTLIPTIIWPWVGAENLGGTNRIYTIGDVAANGSSNTSWLKTAYTSGTNCNTGFGTCSWMKNSSDTMICKLMLGGKHSSNHNSSIWTSAGSSNLFGTGLVNRIQTQVDATAENGSNTFYYLRGYWTPYGSGKGSISLTKTNASGSAKLSGAEFTLYRDAACTIPVTSSDYETLSSSDTGYVSASVRRTNGSGLAQWTGLYTGTYFLKETKAPDGYQVNVDTSGNVQVKEVTVSGGTSNVTLTNAENAKQVSLKKTINATQACIDQIKGNPLYSLAGAEYSVTVNGNLFCKLFLGQALLLPC